MMDIVKIGGQLLDHPLISAIMLVDFIVMTFHHPPALASIILLAGLVAISMFFGQKLSLFKIRSTTKPE